MGDESTDIKLNLKIFQERSEGGNSESKKSSLQRKLEWKQKREQKRKLAGRKIKIPDAGRNSHKGNAIKTDERGNNSLEGSKNKNSLDSGVKHGKFNNQQGKFDKLGKFHKQQGKFDKLGKFHKQQGKFDSNQGKFYSNQGKFYSSQGKFDSRQGKFDSRRGKYDSSQGKYDSSQGKVDNNQGNFDSSQGKFDSRQGKFDSRKGKFDNSQGKFDSSQGKFDSSQGKFDSNQGKFDSREGKFNYQGENFNFKPRNFNNAPKKNKGKPVEPAFASSMLRNAMLPTVTPMTQPQYIFDELAGLANRKSQLNTNVGNSNLKSSFGEGTNKMKRKNIKLIENASGTDISKGKNEDIVSFKKPDNVSKRIGNTEVEGLKAPGLFLRKSRKRKVSQNKSGNVQILEASDSLSKVMAEDEDHGVSSNDVSTTLTRKANKNDTKHVSRKRQGAVEVSSDDLSVRKKGEIMLKAPEASQNKSGNVKIPEASDSLSKVIAEDEDRGVSSNDVSTTLTRKAKKNDVKNVSRKSEDAVDVSSDDLSKRKKGGIMLKAQGLFFRKSKKLEVSQNKSGNVQIPKVSDSLSKVMAEDEDHGVSSNDVSTTLTRKANKNDTKHVSRKRQGTVEVSSDDLSVRKKGEIMLKAPEASQNKSGNVKIPEASDSLSKVIAEDEDRGVSSNDVSITLTRKANKNDVKNVSRKRKDAVDISSDAVSKRKRRKKGEVFSDVGVGDFDWQEMDVINNSSVISATANNDSNKSENKKADVSDNESTISQVEYKPKSRELDDFGEESGGILKRNSFNKKGTGNKKLPKHTESEIDSFTQIQTSFSEHSLSEDGSLNNLSKRKKRENVKPLGNDDGGEVNIQKVKGINTFSDVNTVSFQSKSKKGIVQKDGCYDNEKRRKVEGMDFGSKGNWGKTEDSSDSERKGTQFEVKSSLFRNNPAIRSVGQRAIRPVKEELFSKEKFADLDIHKYQVSNLESLGLSRLTVVQRKAIPPVFEGHDVLVRSQTGSGKTLAYALPIVEMLQRQKPPLTRADGVRALIVLPTRELVLQTYDWFSKLVGPFLRLVPGMLLGGEKRKSEKARLRKGITILMGTPGRIRDHLEHTSSLSLHAVQYLVLDEADCMLDMGYERDIASILRILKSHSEAGSPTVLWKKRNMTETVKIKNKEKNNDTDNKATRIVFNSDDDEEKGNEENPGKEIGKKEYNCKEEKSGKKEVNAIDTKAVGQQPNGIKDEDDGSDYDPEILADEAVPLEAANETGGGDETDDSEDSDATLDDFSQWKKEKSPASEKTRGGSLLAEAESEEAREPGKWQSILLSATLTPAVERLAGLVLRSPTFVDAADVEADSTDIVIPHTLAQSFMVVPAKLRLVVLSAFIAWKCKFTDERKILLFCATLDMVNYLTELLTIGLGKSEDDIGEDEIVEESTLHLNIEFFRLHGDMEQKERTHVFQTFRAAKSGVLLCTDVAARGLDMPRVDWIVQLTAPGSVADYVHRVGRTARVGRKGNAVLFLLPSEVEMVELLQDRRIRLEEQDIEVCLQKLLLATRYQNTHRNFKSKEDAASALQLMYEEAVVKRSSLRGLAINAFQSYVRFYASYPKDMRDILSFKALHLGHAAKSFALRDPPRTISGIGRRRGEVETHRPAKRVLNPKLELTYGEDYEGEGEGQNKRPKGWSKRRDGQAHSKGKFFGRSEREYSRNLILSEFASGLDSGKT